MRAVQKYGDLSYSSGEKRRGKRAFLDKRRRKTPRGRFFPALTFAVFA